MALEEWYKMQVFGIQVNVYQIIYHEMLYRKAHPMDDSKPLSLSIPSACTIVPGP